MLTDRARVASRGVVEPLALALARLGVTANALTVGGALLHVLVAWLVAGGDLFVAGLALILAGSCDALDGSLARATGTASPFGAFLDSTLDRLSETLLFLGLLAYVHATADAPTSLVTMAALAGSLMVSYARARGAAIGRDTRVGLFDRFVRTVLLVAGLLTGYVVPVLWMLAGGTWWTVAQRVQDVRRQCAADDR